MSRRYVDIDIRFRIEAEDVGEAVERVEGELGDSELVFDWPTVLRASLVDEEGKSY